MSINFEEIKDVITDIYNSTKTNKDGHVASYIPQLSKVNPDLFGISICTVNGEQFNIGDTDINFCIQSCSKPISYCIAQSLLGSKNLHKYVGYEPSGQKFNAFILNDENKPHNPMINAGAIMVTSLIIPEQEPAERFDFIMSEMKKMSGYSGALGFDNSVYLSECNHAHRNYALSHFMAEKKIFPDNTDIKKTLEFYFQLCSISTNSRTMSIIAGTLANIGVCPITNETVINPNITSNCLSLMYMCGMYDFSGRFAFEVGLPAKSGVSGCLILVVPNIMGVCIWSPPLDHIGNSVRGVEVCKKLVKRFSFHVFDKLVQYSPKITNIEDSDSMDEDICDQTNMFISAASKGSINKIKKIVEDNVIDINSCDYDKRSALHLACAEGYLEIIVYLLDHGANKDLKDRWGNTPQHEVNKNINDTNKTENEIENYKHILELLKTKKIENN